MRLELRHATPEDEWVTLVESRLVPFLQDHAANERRVSNAALTLAVQHPDRAELVDAMVETSLEELTHFRLVYRLLKERGATLSREAPDPYMKRLRRETSHRDREVWLLHRLVLFAIVEARGFERFSMLADGLSDPSLREVYGGLARAEARHKGLYLRLARASFDESDVARCLDRFLDLEADVIGSLPLRAALH
ncbi:MAG: tRNA isopentenyl-2-thiomethyl-A-37 hydroxylase MiaE [Sandaracinaceae bacterium]